VLVKETNGRRAVADLLRAAIDACRGKMCDVLIHQSLPIGGNTRAPAGAICSKLI
jgi:hypothetical protein